MLFVVSSVSPFVILKMENGPFTVNYDFVSPMEFNHLSSSRFPAIPYCAAIWVPCQYKARTDTIVVLD